MDAYVLGAVPPYNTLLGGKLIASLARTSDVVEAFDAKYRDSVGIISNKQKKARLAAITTSSALGRSSIYNRLKLGGHLIFEPSDTLRAGDIFTFRKPSLMNFATI